MSAPQVYKAINAITAELARVGIAKRHRNERDDYLYRSIDDVLNRLAPLLAKHKLCILPRVLERTSTDHMGEADQLLVCVALKVAFDLVSTADGSTHCVEAYSEALDPSDKATAKAMSSAYKHAMLQVFCVPVRDIADADASSHRLKRKIHTPCPVEGWEQWAAGIRDIAASCISQEALERLQERNRSLLTTLARERPDLYAALGASFTNCAEAPNGEECNNPGGHKNGAGCAIGATKDGEQCAIKNGEECAKAPAGSGDETRPAPERPAKRRTHKAATKSPVSKRQRQPSANDSRSIKQPRVSHAPNAVSQTA